MTFKYLFSRRQTDNFEMRQLRKTQLNDKSQTFETRSNEAYIHLIDHFYIFISFVRAFSTALWRKTKKYVQGRMLNEKKG